MLLGVMSDSHDNIPNVRRAIEKLDKEGVDLIIHLGDIVSPFTLREICSKGIHVEAVFGNNCGEKMLLSRVAGECGAAIGDPPRILQLNGKKILLLHGFGPKDLTVQIARELASTGSYDVVLFGHTHEAMVEKHGGTLLLNPGETLGYLTGKASVAVVDTERLDGWVLPI
ncbi:MAG: metallophosphoesterase [Desulfurococcales archaeon]|nr:metallophosphoesterase [Desulfurococcales archaeon]